MTKLEWVLFIITLFGPKVTMLDRNGRVRLQCIGVITLFINEIICMATKLLGDKNG